MTYESESNVKNTTVVEKKIATGDKKDISQFKNKDTKAKMSRLRGRTLQ